MRNTQQRLQLAQQKARLLQKQEKINRMMAVSGVFSLCCVVGIACVIPSLLSNYTVQQNAGLFGSVFAMSQSLAYIMVGILSFLLGISFTALCLLLRNKIKEDDNNDSLV